MGGELRTEDDGVAASLSDEAQRLEVEGRGEVV